MQALLLLGLRGAVSLVLMAARRAATLAASPLPPLLLAAIRLCKGSIQHKQTISVAPSSELTKHNMELTFRLRTLAFPALFEDDCGRVPSSPSSADALPALLARLRIAVSNNLRSRER